MHEEQHTTMESLADYGCSGNNDGNKIYDFLQRIKNTGLEAAVDDVWAQQEKYGKNFKATVSYLGQVVMKEGLHKV